MDPREDVGVGVVECGLYEYGRTVPSSALRCVQPADVRSPPVAGGRYYISSSRSEICSVNGGGSRVVPASRVVYRPSATLINPNKHKQYVPRNAMVVGSRTATSYRAVPRSRAGSDWR